MDTLKMPDRTYYAPHGGHPGQKELLTGRAVFTEAYAVIPKGVMQDIVTSALPFWDKTRVWILSRPLSGFSETFSQYIVGGRARQRGSDRPEPDAGAEGALFVVEGELTVLLAGKKHVMRPGGFAFLPPASGWTVHNESKAAVRFHWIRKAYEAVDGLDAPDAFFANEQEIAPTPMPGTEGRWATTPLRRSGRSASRHARNDRHPSARRRHSFRRDPCDGTRPLCAGRQGRLSPE